MRSFLMVTLLGACGGSPAPPPATTTTTVPTVGPTTASRPTAVDCASASYLSTSTDEGAVPVWLYWAGARSGDWAHYTPDRSRLAAGEGVIFDRFLLGPTLVTAPSNLVCFDLHNSTDQTVTVDGSAMDRSVAPTIDEGAAGTWEALAPASPGVYLWSDPSLEGAGLAGLVVVRDPALVAAVEPTAHLNFVLFAPDVPVEHRCAECDVGVPAPVGEPLLVTQQLFQVWRPEGARHGGPPNEFITSTYEAATTSVLTGARLWINLFNETSTAHTLDLGDLPLGPGGAPVGAITLQPGEGLSLAGPMGDEEASFPITCTDCPDTELASAVVDLVLPLPEDTGGAGGRGGSGWGGYPTYGGSGWGGSTTYGGSGWGGSYTSGGSGR